MITLEKLRLVEKITTGCLLEYNYLNNYYKKIAIDLSRQQALDADPKARQKITLTGHLARNPVVKTIFFFIVEEVKRTVLDLSQETVKVL